MRTILRVVTLVFLALAATSALADNWTATRLRGTVLELVDGDWRPLSKGSVVPDDRIVLTRGNGRLTLARGREVIELGPNTQVQIYDKGGRKPFTTVLQHFGTVAIEAEVQNVQHFAVRNAFLAAVVKGTRFVVTADKNGGAVEVQRGEVSVKDNRDSATVMIVAGQKAKAERGRALNVTGKPVAVSKVVAKPTAAVVTAAHEAALEALEKLEEAKAGGDPDAIREATEEAKIAIDTAEQAQDASKTPAVTIPVPAKTDTKAAEDAAKAAEKAAKDAAKAAEEARKAAEEADKKAGKDAQKAAEEAEKAAEDARKAAEKAAEDAEKAAEKAAKDAEKAAKKAAEDAAKAAEKAAKDAAKDKD